MHDELKELGFNEYECRIISELAKDRFDISNLSKKAKIPFGRIYSIIKELKKRNIVKETNTRPKLIYIDNLTEIIGNLIKEKQEKEKKLYDELRKTISNIEKDKKNNGSFFEIGMTNEDNKRIQLRSFLESETEVLQILNIHHKPKSNRINKNIWENEIINAVKRGVVFKSIYPVNCKIPEALEKLNKNYPKKFSIKRRDTDFIRCDIIDRKKVLIKLVWEDPLLFGGVIFIESENFAENLIKIFNELWGKEN